MNIFYHLSVYGKLTNCLKLLKDGLFKSTATYVLQVERFTLR